MEGKKLMTKKRFQAAVLEEMREYKLTHIEGVLSACTRFNLEPEDVKKYVDDMLKDKIQAEATSLNLLVTEEGEKRSLDDFEMKMPQASAELQEEWGDDITAMNYLTSRGFCLLRGWRWFVVEGQLILPKDKRAMQYLMEEWDFGGWIYESEYRKEIENDMCRKLAKMLTEGGPHDHDHLDKHYADWIMEQVKDNDQD